MTRITSPGNRYLIAIAEFSATQSDIKVLRCTL